MKLSAFIQLAADEPVHSLICLTSDSWHSTSIARFCELINVIILLNEVLLSHGPVVFDSDFWLSPSFTPNAVS